MGLLCKMLALFKDSAAAGSQFCTFSCGVSDGTNPLKERFRNQSDPAGTLWRKVGAEGRAGDG